MTKNSKVRMFMGLAAAAAIVGTLVVGVSYAQQPATGAGPMRMGHGGMMWGGPFAAIRRGLAQLGLSDQQKAQIKGIFQSHKADLQGFAARMQPARQALNSAITNGADEATIRKASADVAAVQADFAVFRASVRAEVFAVLTPDQQAKATQLQLQAQQRAGRFMGRRKQGPGL